MQSKQKVFTLVSRHYFTVYGRKTTVHFIAREFVKLGYQVNFITVGRSRLSQLGKAEGKGIPKDLSYTKFHEIEPSISAIVLDELIHPVSSANKIIKASTSPALLRYGQNLPNNVENQISSSDIILIECGYGVAYYETMRKKAKDATFVYFATDPLTQVGLREEFEDIETQALPSFDLVRVANADLAERFPPNTNVIQIPQGLDKKVFDDAKTSPYENGTENLISIGDMAFDQKTLCHMATARPDIFIHVFGANVDAPHPANILVHGEVDFSTLVPYIKFANVGVMPYKMTSDMGYLTKTSLKFLQYTYCGLPILTPQGPDWERKKIFSYDAGNLNSITKALNLALAEPEDMDMGTNISDWSDCVKTLIAQINKVREI